MKGIFQLGNFVRNVYLERRFARLSPLTLLRVGVGGWQAECDWVMQSRCAWDTNRPVIERVRNASLQAIEDALAVRKLLFCVLPQADTAMLRVYRRGPENQLELVITGTVKRRERVDARIRSLAMKGKLYGLQFRMSEEGLEALQTEDWQGGSTPEFVGNAEISTNGGS